MRGARHITLQLHDSHTSLRPTNLGRRAVRGVRDAHAEAERARRDRDDALLRDRLADDAAARVGRCNVRDRAHALDHGGVPRVARVGRVRDQVETVGDRVDEVRDAVARGLGRPELGLVAVGRLAPPAVECVCAARRHKRT